MKKVLKTKWVQAIVVLVILAACVGLWSALRGSTNSVAARTPQELLIENVGLAEFNSQNDATSTNISSEEKSIGQQMSDAGKLVGDGSDKSKIQQSVAAISGLINKYPDFSVAYLQRAMDNVLLGSTDYQSIATDVDNAIKYCGKGKYSIESAGCDSTAPMYAFRAKVDALSGNYKQEMDDLNTAVTMKPDSLHDVFNTGGVKPSDTSNPTSLQESDFNTLVAQFPSDYRSYLFRGLFYNQFSFFDNQYYNTAISDVKQAIALNPNSDVANYILGSIYQKAAFNIYSWKINGGTAAYDSARAQINQKALQYFNTAIQLNPSSTYSYIGAAEALSELNRYPEAIADYKILIQLNPNDYGSYNDKALAEESTSTNDYFSAISDLTDSIRIQRATSSHQYLEEAYENRGDAYMKEDNNYADAIDDYSNAIGLKFGSQLLLMSLSQIRSMYPEFAAISDKDLIEGLRQKYNPNMSSEDFTKALTTNKPFSDFVLAGLYEKRGNAYWAANNFRNAAQEYARALHDDSTYVMDRWKEFSTDLTTDSYLDTQTLDIKQTSTVSLWVKNVNNNASNYSEQNFEIDCASKRIKSLTSISYDALGNAGISRGEQDWQSVIPQSMGETLYSGVCPSED